MSSLLSIGTSAVLTYQQALNVTGNNISNAGTDGYSRRTVDLETAVGSGVQIASVERQYDTWATSQLNSAAAANSYYQTYLDYATQLDAMLGDTDTGIGASLNALQSAIQDVANDPTSTAARQAMLSAADQLADSINSLDRWLAETGSGVNATLGQDIDRVNELSAAVADLNQAIAAATPAGQPSADLLDQRDLLVQEIAGLTGARAVEADDGSLNLYLANGQTLVSGNRANRLETGSGDDAAITLVAANGTRSDVTTAIQGGEIGALGDFRDDMLSAARDTLDSLATDIATRMNALQANGMDLDGATGSALFSISETDPAGSLSVALTDPDGIAAASPVRSEADADNTGSGQLSPASATDTDNALFQTASGSLSPPLAVVFSAPDSYDLLDYSDPSNPVVIESGIAYDATADNSLFPTPSGLDYGISATLSGAPDTGDTFYLTYNTGGTGDNSNALRMAALLSGESGFSETSGAMLSGVATRTRQLETSATAAGTLYDQAVSRRESVSGVNLDEEAANLVRYQQGYDAAAQVIAVADELFQTILDVARS